MKPCLPTIPLLAMIAFLPVAMAGTCQQTGGAGLPLPCPLALSEPSHEFSMTIPCDFREAAPTTTLSGALLQKAYVQDLPRFRLNVFVTTPTDNSQTPPGVVIQELGTSTNSHGVEFTLRKVTINNVPGYTLGAGATLPSENELLIQVSGLDNEADARAFLDQAVTSVFFE